MHNKPLHNYLQYAGIGLRMAIIMAISIWLGLSLDKYFALRFPVFLSIFSVGSTVLSMYITIRKLLYQVNKDHTASERKEK